MVEKSVCACCEHFEVCKLRETYENVLKRDSVRYFDNMINGVYDWIDIKIECKHYEFSLAKCIRKKDMDEEGRGIVAVPVFASQLLEEGGDPD